jgi:preprotein translocase subunit SecE
MAQVTKDKDRKPDPEEDEDEASSETSEGADDSSPRGDELARAGASIDDGEDAASEGDDAEGDAADEDGEDAEGGTSEEEQAAAQLGTDRYVLAGFFAAGMLGAYVIGRSIQTAWINASNKDWFSQRFPALTAVADDDKSMYGIIVGGIVALVVVYRTYKRPDVRAWADEVAAELGKVVWPSWKDVQSSTFIVVVASIVATLYLTLLDRLWAFVTNIVYGADGS